MIHHQGSRMETGSSKLEVMYKFDQTGSGTRWAMSTLWPHDGSGKK